LDFICHFHFLRDLGKDLLGAEYATLRKHVRDDGITAKLRRRLRALKPKLHAAIPLLDLLESPQQDSSAWSDESLKAMPALATFSLLHWALEGQHQGHGYGFPFDRPYLVLAHRLQIVYRELEYLQTIPLRQDAKDNLPLQNAYGELRNFMHDGSVWTCVGRLDADSKVFETLRKALRIAPKTSHMGLNADGHSQDIGTIKAEVEQFKRTIVQAPGYAENGRHRKMIAQIDKYWQKLFADPIEVETPTGKTWIQPQRTNNFAEQHFRDVKRGYRQKTGHGALGKTLRTMLANTPLVKNLQNAEYMAILLDGKPHLADVFAEIESTEVREELKKAQTHVEKIPTKLRTLTGKTTYPELLRTCFTKLKSNGILC
jgi:hypothetical protein